MNSNWRFHMSHSSTPKTVGAQFVLEGETAGIMTCALVCFETDRCWQVRDYRTVIAVAQRIPETILQEDPKLLMWYDQALTRTGGAP